MDTNQASPQQRALPAMAAAGLIVSGVVAGHALIGVACGVTAGLGVYLRTRSRTRAAGSILLIAAAGTFMVLGLDLLSQSGSERHAEARPIATPPASSAPAHPAGQPGQ